MVFASRARQLMTQLSTDKSVLFSRKKLRTCLVDTLARIVFFTTVAGLIELFIAGMTPVQVLIARLIVVLVMLTARPYRISRD
jgi:hypothetical protein